MSSIGTIPSLPSSRVTPTTIRAMGKNRKRMAALLQRRSSTAAGTVPAVAAVRKAPRLLVEARLLLLVQGGVEAFGRLAQRLQRDTALVHALLGAFQALDRGGGRGGIAPGLELFPQARRLVADGEAELAPGRFLVGAQLQTGVQAVEATIGDGLDVATPGAAHHAVTVAARPVVVGQHQAGADARRRDEPRTGQGHFQFPVHLFLLARDGQRSPLGIRCSDGVGCLYLSGSL